MLERLGRFLMIEADASPGGGAAPVSTPSAAPATGAAPAASSTPAPTADQAQVQALAAVVRDSVFAELRRTGVLKPTQQPAAAAAPAGGAATTTAAPAAGQATAPTPGAGADFRALDRALMRSGRAAALDDAGYQRIERAFAAEAPPNVDTWVTSFFSSMGLPAPAAAAGTATTPTTPTNGIAAVAGATPPATAPTTPQRVDELTSGGVVDLFRLTPQQLDQLGPAGVRREYEKALEAGRRASGAPPIPKAMQRK